VLVLAADAGVAIADFVIQPLLASPPDAQAALKGAVVIAAIAAGVARLFRGPAPAAPWSGTPSDHPAPLTEAETLRASLALLPPSPDDSPTTLAVHVGAALVEVFWDGPPPPSCPPWRPTETGWVWEANRHELVPCGALDRRRWALLLPVGATPTGTFWLNLAAFRVIALAGDADAVSRRAGAIVRALRRRADSGAVELVVPEDSSLEPAGPPDDAVLERALAVLWQHTARRRAEGATERRAHRRARPADRLVIVAPAAPPLQGLVARARVDPAATVVVIGDHDGADLRLLCAGGNVTVPFLGDVPLRVEDPGLPEPRTTEAPSPDEADERPGRAAEDRARPTDSAAGVEVRVLGPVDVRGAAAPLAGKSLELVVYLACHPRGAPDEQIRAALWPDRAPAPATWAQRVSVTRRALGKDPDGSPRLLRFRRHVGQLSASVSTDVGQLDAALARCREVAGPVTTDAVGSLLDGIRGRPFEAPQPYGWADDEGHVRHAEQSVIDAAHYLAERAFAAGDWERALWSSERGLRACPTSDVLLADRSQAAAAGGVSTGELATRALREALRDLDPRLGLTGPDPDPGASRVTVVDS